MYVEIEISQGILALLLVDDSRFTTKLGSERDSLTFVLVWSLAMV